MASKDDTQITEISTEIPTEIPTEISTEKTTENDYEDNEEYKKYLDKINTLEKAQMERKQQWDEFFMKIACLTALRSKDPRTAVGACIADTSTHEVVGIGYNSMPYIKEGNNDEIFPWKGAQNVKGEDQVNPSLKYPYVVHAAINAVTNRTRPSLTGCTIYLTLHPDCDCALAINRSGIRSIKYCMISYREPSEKDEAQKLLKKIKDMKLYSLSSKSLENDFVGKLRKRNFEGYKVTASTSAYKGLHYLTWEDFFMTMARLCKERPGVDSKPENVQGVCIVSPEKQVISVRASGFPKDMEIEDTTEIDTMKKEGIQTRKYVSHAEYNAILGGPLVKGCTLYVTKYPCHKCAQVIVQSGITEVVYQTEGTNDEEKNPEKTASYKSSKIILTKCLGRDKIRQYDKKEVPTLS